MVLMEGFHSDKDSCVRQVREAHTTWYSVRLGVEAAPKRDGALLQAPLISRDGRTEWLY